MKEFKTAAVATTEAEGAEEKGTKFKVDGRECTAFRPTGGQLAVLMAETSRHRSLSDQIAGVLNFFDAVLDRDSSQYLSAKLLERGNGFEIEQVQDILEWLMEEWTGRPTK